ncbi:DUF4810 domain-containing protein [Nitrospirillum viridazoti]|uniref:DUF4810 domain-containing protein n=2 Tax=Nitrospirillum TaxID=1543705 RepID=A0A248JRE6_9PROT|nr:DUF4810 domain-containing protein [Nitrospirillum amazonense]ASG21323.1 DUF4810 domain-containing protein [Nitrospirillum amazonense CBAmc]TWB32991.1 hypothetical protein FBZ91_11553 [Nitrospirillum amazonense]TWB62172.1 hypothetical protein FBZ92_105107 [Nitrospirillum amazonense]
MKKGGILMLVVAGVALSACASGPKYNWGEYSSGLLDYYQDPKTEAAYVKDLDTIIATPDPKGKKVPPGIYAEAGYMAALKGDTQKAVDLFNREKAAWPESSAFMDKAIANAKAGGAKPQQQPAQPQQQVSAVPVS